MCGCTTTWSCEQHRHQMPGTPTNVTPNIFRLPLACADCGGRGWTVRTGACSCLVQRLAAAERMIAALQAEVERLRRSGHDVES